MSKKHNKTPLNFGNMIGGQQMPSMFSGSYGDLSDEELRSKYDTYSSMSGMMGNQGMMQQQRTAMEAEIQRRQSLGDFGTAQQASADIAAGIIGAGPSGTDPNNSTGNSTYTINPDANNPLNPGISGGDERLTDIGETTFTRNRNIFARAQQPGLADTAGVNPQEGNFNPTTEQAAKSIFGNSQQFKPRRKLINL